VESGWRQPSSQALGRRHGVPSTALRLDQGHGQLPLDVLVLPPMMNQLGRQRILAHIGFRASGTLINLGKVRVTRGAIYRGFYTGS
jgi:hypothetical protein